MDYSDILPVPPLPNRILEEVENGKLAVFIGAGVSRIIGCIGWRDLAKKLVTKCYKTNNKENQRIINFYEKELLLKDTDHKKIISICYNLLEETGKKEIFYTALKKALEDDPNKVQKYDIYKELARFRGLYITTNADKHFHSFFRPNRIIYDKNMIKPERIFPETLYHIHGMIDCTKTLVFTTFKYLEQYNNPNIVNFLEKVFSEYTILFVGYGLTEFELMEFLVSKAKSKNIELKHFLLKAFFKSEVNICHYESHYYSKMGITLIPFMKDELGYEQLYHIIKEWNKEINQTSNYLQTTYNELDSRISVINPENTDFVLQTILNDQALEDYFLKKLTETTRTLEWLKILYKNGYFIPEKNPKPIEVKKGTGRFIIPTWNILPFLERNGEHILKNPDSEHIKILKGIAEDLIEYRDSNGERNDNYRTDRVIVKLIFSLTKEEIRLEYVDFIETTLYSRWENSLTFVEIEKTVFPRLLAFNLKDYLIRLVSLLMNFLIISEEKTKKHSFDLDKYHIERIISRYLDKIIDIASEEIILNILIIIKKKMQEFHLFRYSLNSIETFVVGQSSVSSKDYVIKVFLDSIKRSKPSQIKNLIENMLKEEDVLLQKFAIFGINEHFNSLRNLFFENETNFFMLSFLRTEITDLLRRNCKEMNNDEISKVLKCIDEINENSIPYPKEMPEEVEAEIASLKRIYLKPLLVLDDSNIKQAYENQVKISNYVEKEILPEAMESELFIDEYIDQESEFSGKTNAEIAEFIVEEFDSMSTQQKQKIGFEFQQYVGNQGNVILKEINEFINLPPTFLSGLFWGLWDYWKTTAQFRWDELFQFCINFLKKREEEIHRTRDDFVIVFLGLVNLIEEYIINGYVSNNIEVTIQLREIYLELEGFVGDLSSSSRYNLEHMDFSFFNCFEGKYYISLMTLIKEVSVVFEEKEIEKLTNPLYDLISKHLNNSTKSLLALLYAIGLNLNSLIINKEKWLNDHYDLIFPTTNDLWEITFTGHLHGRILHERMYRFLKGQGLYHKALNYEFKDRDAIIKLVEKICLTYIVTPEILSEEDSSLIEDLIESENIQYLSEMVKYFWMQRDKEISNISEKIKPIWEKLIFRLEKEIDKEEIQQLIFELSNWLVLVEEIDVKVLEWLLQSVNFAKEDFILFFLVEYLNKHRQKTPREVGIILFEILNVGVYPSYKKIYIVEILETLFSNNEEDLAKRICNIYLENGFTFVREIYEKYS